MPPKTPEAAPAYPRVDDSEVTDLESINPPRSQLSEQAGSMHPTRHERRRVLGNKIQAFEARMSNLPPLKGGPVFWGVQVSCFGALLKKIRPDSRHQPWFWWFPNEPPELLPQPHRR
ncbi:MAG: hypothetical protein CM1200mP9_05890 [Gammaproteobacteria bacterium]|nr:MAG: hypothetical protein CM1200mP9_05890 [Gammaproteobacteria bacterium]